MTGGSDRKVSPELCSAIGELPLPVAWDRVRLYRENCGRRAGVVRRMVLRLSGGRAVALGNHVFLPARCEADPAVLAHEVTHCAQYQAWGPLRYYARGAMAQLRHFAHRHLGLGRNPYVYQPSPGMPFEAYGIEQQAQIVEDARRGSAAARAITEARRRPG
jgi:hypothetical protein